MKRHYIDGPDGQIHTYQWGDDTSQPPIVCLSPSPFSGKAYITLAPLLAEKRRVIAVDYPGYGNSDACAHAPDISDYAAAVSAVIKQASDSQTADLLGFHSGCLVAVDASLNHAPQVRNLVLVDVPFFSPDKQAELLIKMGASVDLSSELTMLTKPWTFCVAGKLEHIPLPRAYDMFVDHIATGRNTNAAFNAAFRYPCAERFKQITHRTHVIASKAGLFDESRATADVIPGAMLVEHTDITVAVLEKGAIALSETINDILNETAHREFGQS